MTRRSLAVIVIHYGRSKPTESCVASIRNDPSETPRTIIVVDNFGNLQPEVFAPHCVVLNRSDNPGFGAGANAGVDSLPHGLDPLGFVVLNNDVTLKPLFLDAAATALSQDRVGAAGGPIWDPQHHFSDPWYAGGRIRRLTGTVTQSTSSADARTARDVGFIPGTAMAIRRSAWQDVGGFDPGFFLYNEDIDICLRLLRRGWRLVFEPAMACLHNLGETTGSTHRSALYLEQLSRTRLRPFQPRAYRLYLCAVHTLYNALRITVLFLQQGRASRSQVRAIARGHRAAVAEILGLTKARPRRLGSNS